MAGVKEAIEHGQLNVKLLNICPDVSPIELPYDLNIKDALKKKMTPVVNMTGLDHGSSNVSANAMVAYYLTNDLQEFIDIYDILLVVDYFSFSL